ncbi:glutathione peroxidase [Sporosarcina sp. FSL K6-1522]|uniref:glutathione peroxidase n=1 Tax=Sporosarcina sp. FSL K6-1522 TaxID=2921554 RepID=UPI00315A3720
MKTLYEFSVRRTDGTLQLMDEYKGKPLIIVNTASKCGFTNQFKELQELYEEYQNQGLVILGFPSGNFNNQEFENIDKTIEFCEINFGVTFPMFAKVHVKGKDIEPLFAFLISEKKGLLTEGIKWNFTKFLIDREGNVVERIAPQVSPLKMQRRIDQIV